MKTLRDYTVPLQELLESHADGENAEPMRQYMQDRFEFYGIKTPKRRALVKAFFEEKGLPPSELLVPLVDELWERPQREYQYAAVGVLQKMMKSRETPPISPGEMIELFERLITTKSWWDTVDGIATRVVGVFFQRYPEFIESCTDKWISSGNIWLQRTAILFQLKYKERTDEALLFSIVRQLTDSREFFIRKAIGWALHEYSKTFPLRVVRFVRETPMAPLSKREALKVIKKSNR